MSLIKCDDCGSDISDSSLFCPHCGRPTHLNKAYPHPGEVPEAYTKLAEAIKEEPKVANVAKTATVAADDGAERARRRNERLKVVLFLAVFVVILGLVLWVYFFMPRPEQEDELSEATEEITIVEDSASTASAASPDTAPAAPAVPAAAKPGAIAPKAAPAAAPAPKAERTAGEVTMKSLQEQAAHPVEAPAAESPASPAESTVP